MHRQNTSAVNNRRLILPGSKRLERLLEAQLEKKANLEAKWIHTAADAMQSTMTTRADELIDIEEKDIYASIRKKSNWSSPGNDKITNYWLKTLSTTLNGLAKAVSKIINNDIPLTDWLVAGKCVMILKKENPQAKHHRPITLLNTM